jgi:hypothetical protein
MKNTKLILAAALMVMMTAVSVQTKAQKGYSFNFNAMVQNSWLFNSDDSDMDDFSYKAYIHPAFSLGAGYNFTEKLGIGLDVMYSFQGRKQEYNGDESRLKLDYLKIPLYFHFNTNPAQKWMFSLNVGPQFNILTTAKHLDANDNETDIKDAYEDLTFGGFIGAGAEYQINEKFNVFCMARFDYDLTNPENEDALGYDPDRANSHNSTLGLQVGLRYKLSQ